MKRTLPLLFLGILFGVAGSMLWPRFVAPHLPAGLGAASTESIDGTVLRKMREDAGRLLLTVETGRGAVLAIFTERVAEIDILVEEGDAVTLALPAYEPFVENPAIQGVRKGFGAAAEAPPPSAENPAPPPAAELDAWPGDRDGG